MINSNPAIVQSDYLSNLEVLADLDLLSPDQIDELDKIQLSTAEKLLAAWRNPTHRPEILTACDISEPEALEPIAVAALIEICGSDSQITREILLKNHWKKLSKAGSLSTENLQNLAEGGPDSVRIIEQWSRQLGLPFGYIQGRNLLWIIAGMCGAFLILSYLYIRQFQVEIFPTASKAMVMQLALNLSQGLARSYITLVLLAWFTLFVLIILVFLFLGPRWINQFNDKLYSEMNINAELRLLYTNATLHSNILVKHIVSAKFLYVLLLFLPPAFFLLSRLGTDSLPSIWNGINWAVLAIVFLYLMLVVLLLEKEFRRSIIVTGSSVYTTSTFHTMLWALFTGIILLAAWWFVGIIEIRLSGIFQAWYVDHASLLRNNFLAEISPLFAKESASFYEWQMWSNIEINLKLADYSLFFQRMPIFFTLSLQVGGSIIYGILLALGVVAARQGFRRGLGLVLLSLGAILITTTLLPVFIPTSSGYLQLGQAAILLITVILSLVWIIPVAKVQARGFSNFHENDFAISRNNIESSS